MRAPVSVSASVDVPGSALGNYDLAQLAALRDLAERHVNTAMMSLTASVDPTSLITSMMLDEFDEFAWLSWLGGTDIVALAIGPQMLPLSLIESTIAVSISDARNTYAELLRSLLGKDALSERVMGEFISAPDRLHNVGSIVRSGDVRPLLTRLGGGSVDPTIPLWGGITTGQTMQDWLGMNGVATTNKKIWLYGFDEQPRRVFNGHMQMDGLVFESWDDPALRVAPQDIWIRRETYEPGDHWGCACVVAPYLPNMGAEFPISLT